VSETRVLDTGSAPERFARGWHCLGLEREFTDGKPHSVQAFGGKLVVWSDAQGELHVLDGYCRHMGGDLTQGTVKGDEIACPFHDWRWGGDGKCKAIPYAKRVPLRARTQRYESVVRNGQLLIWHDPEGSPADMDALPPVLEGVGTDRYTEWTWDVIEVNNAHCREIIDNVVDMAHFFYIHGSLPTQFKNIFEGHVATQYMNSAGRPDIGEPGETQMLGTTSVASYFGPSFMIDDLTYHYEDVDHKTVLINCHYPIDANSFVLQYGIIVKKSDALPEELAMQTAVGLGDFVKMGFEQDVEIWKNKARIDNPLLCEEDGPVYQLRRWYEQFYVDVADIAPDMVDRFEYELDTTSPREEWMKVVDANLAARTAAGST
jgi:3-ketosteroid 9alpha-monooxygenase subunit A